MNGRKQAGEVRAVSLSEVIRALPIDRPVALAELVALFGSRAHGGALLLLGLPDALPLPVPSVSAILGVPLVIVSAHLALYGERSVLPRRIAEREVPRRLLAALRVHVARVLVRAERLSHQRWGVLADREHLLGVVCLYLSLLLLAPIPLFNSPPSLCLVLIAWGMIQRDGVFVAAGLVGTAAMSVAMVLIFLWSRSVWG